jgi:lysophospholipase L1-like esterase
VKSFAQLDAADKAADVKPKTLTVEMGERGPDFARYVINGDQLARTKAKLKAKEPLTIVAWGDSITMGSQLWTSGDKVAQAKAIYHALLAEKLKKKYGDDAIKVVNSSKGGYQTHQALPNIQKEVLDYKPDLVIMAVCAGDTLYSNFDTFKTNWTKIVEKLRAEGIEVIVRTPTPIEYGVKQGEPFAEYIRTYAKEQKLPMDDQRACFLARGEAALGELIPDDAHPNQRGHELMADVLFELFK